MLLEHFPKQIPATAKVALHLQLCKSIGKHLETQVGSSVFNKTWLLTTQDEFETNYMRQTIKSFVANKFIYNRETQK